MIEPFAGILKYKVPPPLSGSPSAGAGKSPVFDTFEGGFYLFITMKRLVVILTLLAGCTSRPVLNTSHGLSQDIDLILRDTILRTATVGIKVLDLQTGETVYEKNPGKLLLPASNGKIFTAATALYYLGPWFRTHTDFFADSEGNLFVKGYGDMGFTYRDLLYVAEILRQKLEKPPRCIYVDGSYFDSLKIGQGWMWDDLQYYYSSRISALSVDENVVSIFITPGKSYGFRPEVRTFPSSRFFRIVNEAVTVSDTDSLKLTVALKPVDGQEVIFVEGQIPGNSVTRRYVRSYDLPEKFFGYHLGELLSDSFNGCVRETTFVVDSTLDTLLILPSRPLSELVREMMKWSSNFKAECILKLTAAELLGPPGSARKGISLVKRLLDMAGVDTTKFRLVDGSGLSRYDLVSADIITKLLYLAYRKFSFAPEFLTSMPIGGRDGTLRKRFTEKRVFVRAKTGTMTSVSSLSGYLETNSGRKLAFSIIINNFIGSVRLAKGIEDRIVLRLKEL